MFHSQCAVHLVYKTTFNHQKLTKNKQCANSSTVLEAKLMQQQLLGIFYT